MIKRTIFFFMAVFLCGVISFAQNKRVEYEKLVDYVNCFYAEKYISNKISDIKKEEDKKAFNKYKNVFLTRVKSYSEITIGIDKSVPNSTSVYNALRKFATLSNPKSKELWQYIDDKKSKYDENWNKEEMIEQLILLTDEIKVGGQNTNYQTYLNKSTEILRTNLQNQIQDNLFISGENITNGSVEDKGTNSDKLTKGENIYSPSKEKNIRGISKNKEGRTSKFLWGWLSFVCIIAIGFWQRKKLIPIFNSAIKLFKKQINDKQGETVGNSSDVIYNKTENNIQEISKLNNEIRELRRENIKLQNREIPIEYLKDVVKKQIQTNPDFRRFVKSLLKDNNSNNYSEINKEPQSFIREEKNISKEKEVIKENISVLYADSIIDGCFNQVTETPDEDTIFELHLQNEQTASFTISSIAFPRIIARPSFLDGCDKQVLNNAQNVEIINKGTAQKQTDGKWKIINKLNVIIN